MPATHKLVNGRHVPLTAAEAAAIEAEWAANVPEPPRRPRPAAAILADLDALPAPRQAAIQREALRAMLVQLAQQGRWADLPGDEPEA